MATLSPAVLARRVCSVVSAALVAGFAIYAFNLDFAVERELCLLRATGWSAAGALLLSLSMTPLRSLGQRLGRHRALPYLPTLRRSLGITSACFALAHGAVALTTYLWDSWPAIPKEPFLRAGLVTLAILTALLMTSFPGVVRALRLRLWKPLHRLAYVAALFAFQHLMLSPFADRRLVLGLYLALALVSCLRLIRAKRPPAAAPE